MRTILILLLFTGFVGAQVNQVQKLATDVYFHEGDLKGKGHCNNGWIIFEDYVLVIDGNFPSGAKEIIPKIRAITDKPIRFAFDTHMHSVSVGEMGVAILLLECSSSCHPIDDCRHGPYS